jgi:release factor glutamine methyltransferase
MNSTTQAEILQPADTVGALVECGTAALAAAGIPTARLDAEVLLAHACGIDRAALYARWRNIVPADCRSRFDTLVVRRKRREPLQYLVGHQEFWSLDFVVTSDVLIPRPETELLVEWALTKLAQESPVASRSPLPLGPSIDCEQALRDGPRRRGLLRANGKGLLKSSNEPITLSSRRLSAAYRRVPVGESRQSPLGEGEGSLRLCDLGTGSGCIAVALARELPRAQIWALDISEAALDVAQFNAQRHGVTDRIRFLASDGFAAANGLRFDAIVCNPPYVSSRELQRAQPELAWEPRHALAGGPTGLTVIERIVAEAPGCLKERGWLLMEMGADQSPAVEQLARAVGFSSVSILADYAGLPRALVAKR